jgi:hypothetical protein
VLVEQLAHICPPQCHRYTIDASFNSGPQVRTLKSIMSSQAPRALCYFELEVVDQSLLLRLRDLCPFPHWAPTWSCVLDFELQCFRLALSCWCRCHSCCDASIEWAGSRIASKRHVVVIEDGMSREVLGRCEGGLGCYWWVQLSWLRIV